MSAYKYLINTEEDFKTLVQYLDECPAFAYDTETNGKFSRFEVQLVGISFGFDLFACYIPLSHVEGEQLDINDVISQLKPIFEDENKKIFAHNAKFDEMVLSVYGIDVSSSGDDTYLMAWLLSEERGSKGLKALTQQHLHVKMETYEDVISKIKPKRGQQRDFNFAKVRLSDALSYASDDAYFTYQLQLLFSQELKEQKLLNSYEKIERPCNRVLRDIEARGVNIDEDYLSYADKAFPKIAEKVEASIYEQAGEVFMISSPAQLGRILFKKLRIGDNIPRTKSGNYSTSKKTLLLYASTNQIVDDVLRMKKIQKTHSTFVKNLLKYVDKDGKVHPSFNGAGTVTGRLNCKEPNLQQIEANEVEEIKVRNFFIPSDDHVFIVGDYSQIELRIMAHLSKDENMIDAFLSGRDFHEETARKVFHIPLSQEVEHRQRFGAKAVNFGTGYGRGAQSIAEQVGCKVKCTYWPSWNPGQGKWMNGTRDERCHECGKCFIEDWFDTFPRVRELKTATVESATRLGYIRTLSGRKRRLAPEINSKDNFVKSSAQRQAFNTRIQGSAADIIKLAMVPLSATLKALDSFIVIQIHDELVIEAPKDKAEEVLVTTKKIMENPLNGKNPLCLPLVTDPVIVERWGDSK